MRPEEQNKAQGKLGGKVLVPWGERKARDHGSKYLSVTSRWEQVVERDLGLSLHSPLFQYLHIPKNRCAVNNPLRLREKTQV